MLGSSNSRTSLGSSVLPSVAFALAERAKLQEPTLSFEFFPPKDDEGVAKLWATFDRLLEVEPDFVSVTYGAGGSNREKSFSVVERMAPNVLTIGHLTAVGASKASTRETIDRYRDSGLGTILALRGDSPKDDPDALAKGDIKTALELVALAHDEFGLEVGVAAFPEKHPESPSLEHDAMILGLKAKAGATFGMTQLFFTVEAYQGLLAHNKAAGVDMPILPGLMPISNVRNVIRMAELSGAALPVGLLADLEGASSDDEARRIGMDYAMQLGRDLLAAGAPGLHVFSLNHHAAALELSRGIGLVS